MTDTVTYPKYWPFFLNHPVYVVFWGNKFRRGRQSLWNVLATITYFWKDCWSPPKSWVRMVFSICPAWLWDASKCFEVSMIGKIFYLLNYLFYSTFVWKKGKINLRLVRSLCCLHLTYLFAHIPTFKHLDRFPRSLLWTLRHWMTWMASAKLREENSFSASYFRIWMLWGSVEFVKGRKSVSEFLASHRWHEPSYTEVSKFNPRTGHGVSEQE